MSATAILAITVKAFLGWLLPFEPDSIAWHARQSVGMAFSIASGLWLSRRVMRMLRKE